MDLKFRTLKASELEVRVGNTAKDDSGFFLLLYKTARVDANVLDETVGVYNWQKKYYQVKNTMVCSIGIYNPERKEWIWKDDGGDDETQMEQVKSELSDSFKRAGFCLGIGRELYYSPKIYVPATKENTKYSRYSIKIIEYDENKRITDLTIVNDKTQEVVFFYQKGKKVSLNGEKAPKTTNQTQSKQEDLPQEPKGSIDNEDLEYINRYIEVLTNKEKFFNWLDEKYNTMNPAMLTYSQGVEIVSKLSGRGKK